MKGEVVIECAGMIEAAAIHGRLVEIVDHDQDLQETTVEGMIDVEMTVIVDQIVEMIDPQTDVEMIEIVETIVDVKLHQSSVIIIVEVLAVMQKLTIMCATKETQTLKTVTIRQTTPKVEIDATDSESIVTNLSKISAKDNFSFQRCCWCFIFSKLFLSLFKFAFLSHLLSSEPHVCYIRS